MDIKQEILTQNPLSLQELLIEEQRIKYLDCNDVMDILFGDNIQFKYGTVKLNYRIEPWWTANVVLCDDNSIKIIEDKDDSSGYGRTWLSYLITK